MNFSVKSKLPVEIWAGIECTVNRVNDAYLDQLECNGHARRLEDLDLFASLGIKTIRYPVLWEKIAPNDLKNPDWSWPDLRLKRLQELEICPIVGLLHHGSGPVYTSLIDPEFPEKLACYARQVADRYPWVSKYTPINEPLTTARFSGLYGHWYPHGRDEQTFARALLNQCRGIIKAMNAIREVNPSAQLIQTEDLGKIYSTPTLAYQADFENERRWLSFDLLCGRLNSSHPMWSYLLHCGVSVAELEWFLDNPCTPDLLGINHYLTSDRFLDERLHLYPCEFHGGNGRHQYADVEAVRVRPEGICAHYGLLREAWERYNLPLAITEVHLNCSREEQLRWFYEAWLVAIKLQKENVKITAITAWALLGSYDWNSLLTRWVGDYEPGVFDLRSSQPRPTAIAHLLRDLANGRQPTHPIFETPGWWKRSIRLTYGETACMTNSDSSQQPQAIPPLAIIGATGTLGTAFARLCEQRGISYRLLSRHDVDITCPISVESVFNELKPWAVVNAAGYVRVDDAEHEPDLCLKINTHGAVNLAKACEYYQVKLLTFSSDLVFDGTASTPYVETDAIGPLNVYGQSKALAEQQVIQSNSQALIIRSSAFFGPWDNYNFVTSALRHLEADSTFMAAEDVIVSPTYIPDLVNASLDLLLDGESGLWHLANQDAITWADLARLAAKCKGVSTHKLVALPVGELGFVALRPAYSALGSHKGKMLPSLESAIARYCRE